MTKAPSNSPLALRLATLDDRPQLLELINAAFAIETFFDSPRTCNDGLAQSMQSGEILVGVDDAGLIQASIYLELRGSVGYLGMLAVNPARQRQGLGPWMLAQAEQRLCHQGCQTAQLTILSLRPELQPLYQYLGYAVTGTDPFVSCRPFQPGLDCHCIVMAKPL